MTPTRQHDCTHGVVPIEFRDCALDPYHQQEPATAGVEVQGWIAAPLPGRAG